MGLQNCWRCRSQQTDYYHKGIGRNTSTRLKSFQIDPEGQGSKFGINEGDMIAR